MSKDARSLFAELDGVVQILKKEFDMDEDKDKKFRGDDEEYRGDDEEEGEEKGDEKKPNPFAGKETREEEEAEGHGGGMPYEKSLRKGGIDSYQMQSSGGKYDTVGKKRDEYQENFVEEEIDDEKTSGQKNYDKADKGYGGRNMPPQLMHPKEYEALYNQIVTDGRKGPSINTTTVSNEQAYESAKSQTVDVTDFLKSFDERINMLGGNLAGLNQMVDKMAEAQIASSKAIARMMKAPQGRQSVASLGKSQTAQQPQLNANAVLGILEKGVADGELSPIELTKFEMQPRITEGIASFLAAKGVK